MSAECLGILKSILSKILIHFMAFISASGWCLVSCYNDVSCLIDGRPDLLRLNHIHCLTKKKTPWEGSHNIYTLRKDIKDHNSIIIQRI